MEGRGPAALLGVAGLVASGLASAARPHVEGPPPGHTGGFGEPTCVECHIGSPLNEPGSTLEVAGLDGGYRPGRAHRVTIRLESYDMLAAGFQASFRVAEGPRRGWAAGTVRPLDDRVAVASGPAGKARYVQHTRPGTAVVDEAAEWSFEWTAPESGVKVALHVSANSGSGDNSPLDDLVYTHASSLDPVSR